MRTLLVAFALLAALAAHGQIRTGSAVPLPHPWPMDHGNPARSGKSVFPGAQMGELAWSARVGGRVYGLACDRTGRTHVGVSFNDSAWSGELYTSTLDRDGTVAWRLKVRPYVWGASQNVRSNPAVTSAGTVYMNSGYGDLLKFSRNGNLLQTILGMNNASNNAAPVVLPNDDVIHFQLVAMKRFRPDGSEVWTTSATSQSDPAVAPNGDVALGGVRTTEPHGSRDVTYFHANGTLRWAKNSTFGVNTQVCFGPDGTLYTTVGGTTAYNPDGSVKWNSGFGGFLASLNGIGQVVVPSGNLLRAMDKDTGAPAWSLSLPFSGSIVSGVAIDSADRIYVTSTDGFVACVSPAGTLLWNLKVCDEFTSQPAIAAGSGIVAAGKVGFDEYFVYRIN